jgi:hypothetical protein
MRREVCIVLPLLALPLVCDTLIVVLQIRTSITKHFQDAYGNAESL